MSKVIPTPSTPAVKREPINVLIDAIRDHKIVDRLGLDTHISGDKDLLSIMTIDDWRTLIDNNKSVIKPYMPHIR